MIWNNKAFLATVLSLVGEASAQTAVEASLQAATEASEQPSATAADEDLIQFIA